MRHVFNMTAIDRTMDNKITYLNIKNSHIPYLSAVNIRGKCQYPPENWGFAWGESPQGVHGNSHFLIHSETQHQDSEL